MNMLAVRVSIGCIFSAIDLKPGWFTTKFFLTQLEFALLENQQKL
jgi:hypothetical protein